MAYAIHTILYLLLYSDMPLCHSLLAMKGDDIKRIRKSMGLTQQEFAAKLGVSFGAVNRWERGHNEPQPDRLMRIREMHAEYSARINPTDTLARSVEKTRPLDFEGDPEAIKLVVDAFRLRNGHLFNKAYGLELSRVVPLPHQ